MFDPNSVNLVSIFSREDYQRTLKIWNEAIVPLVEAISERLEYEWDKRAKIEIGYDTYVMKPNESGGYSWSKIDPLIDIEWDFDDDLEEVNKATTEPVTSSPAASPFSSTEATPLPGVTSKEPAHNENTPDSPNSSTVSPTPSPPDHIDLEHWQEIVEGSAIDPDIASRNFKSLQHDSVEQANEAWEYLMYSNNISRRNDGRLRDGDLNRYQHLEKGGWWCNAGVDPRSFPDLQPGDKPDEKLWGCFKPNAPRESSDKPGKFIKYEHPPKTDLSIFLLDVPGAIANKIYDKAGVNPTESDRQSGFWYCAWKHNLPIIVTEGAKKAGSLLSQGHAAIGLPGINAGYRSRDEQGNPIQPQLREEFAMFANKGRDIKFCFDHDIKPKTIRNVNIALLQTGNLLEKAGANVSVIALPGPEKGVDDFTVKQGSVAFEQLFKEAQPLKEWQKNYQPPDLKFTILLKNGEVLKLYEKQADGTVSANPANLSSEEVANSIPKPRSSPEPQAPINSKNSENNSSKEEANPNVALPLIENNDNYHESQNQQYWAAQQQVPIYAKTLPRQFLLKKENQDIASTAKQLIDNYGVELDDSSLVYKSDAFTVRKFRDTYSIHRAEDEQNTYFAQPLMQFEIDKQGKIAITKEPENMLAVERQEFLNVASKENQLPSFYEDAKTLKSHLGSLAPLGTQETIKKIQISEIGQLLNNTLNTAQSRHLQIGAYRIKSENNPQTGDNFIKLFKKENNLDREAIKINLTTNEAHTFKIGQQDVENLQLIAKRVQLEYSQPQSRQQFRQSRKSKNPDIEL
ncbi:MAG: DUF3854 domain-containing protein [Trichormus sp. ATA11-4-KO1]|jgi:hypothetical protein|nr:DUF3854 domain-containing protein [Trichormus sp. ATA11-4-KO1]